MCPKEKGLAMHTNVFISEVIEALVADDMERARDARPVVPIFFTIDDSYAPYLGIALHSLASNASAAYAYDINVLHDGLSEEHMAKLRALARPGFNIRFFQMVDKIAGIENAHCNKLRQDYFTLTIFFRLFIPVMFPEYDKGIYIDSDVVVPGDISKLFEIDLGDNLIGACRDLSITGVPELVAYTNDGVGVGIENYINSGVLLMNCKALREAKLDERFLNLLEAYHFDNIAPDQDYLNVLCHDRIRYLDPCWDAMPVIGEPEMEDPQLIHYNLFAKPWCYDGIPYGDYFWRFAHETDFLEEARANKDGYSEQQKASDASCMATLIRRAGEIANADFNFRTVFNSGQEARL